jgi:hypothetical protein
MKNMRLFVPITKVDAVKRLVYGVAAAEERDKSNEIFDYSTSKPFFQKWSSEMEKASSVVNPDEPSYGNVRAMHGKVAAGKLTSIVFDDDDKLIEVVAKIVDDNEWNKVEEGVYTGFSIGGRYENRWKDGDATRYTADPSEISVVDNPCAPSARFTMVKADGLAEERPFKEHGMTIPTNDEVAALARSLAKAAGDESKWPSHVEAARAELTKEEPTERPVPAVAAEQPVEKAVEPTPNAPAPDLEQVWQARDGKTFAKKADAVAHNAELDELAKRALDPATQLASALDGLKGTIEKAEAVKPSSEPAVTGTVEKKEFDTDQREKDAKSGVAMPDGSFPIETTRDLANAVKAFGRAKDKKAVKAHIKARAKALGAEDQLPDSWKDGADAKKAAYGDLEKGMDTVSDLARLIQQLEDLHECMEYEAKWENDDSPNPMKLKEDIANLAATLRAVVEEETNELLNEEEAVEYGELLEMFDAGDLQKVLGAKAPKWLAKAGARHSKDDLDRVQKMHDTSVELGASCSKADKAAPADDLTKALADEKEKTSRLEKAITDGLVVIGDFKARLEKIEAQPLPRPIETAQTTTYRVVDKAADDANATYAQLEELAKNDPEKLALMLVKASQKMPQHMSGTGR